MLAANQVEADPAALHFYEEAAAAAADLGVSIDVFAASEEGMGLTFLEPLNSITGGATYLYHALDEANLPQARIYMNGQHVCLCCSSSCSKQIFCCMCSVVSSILFLKTPYHVQHKATYSSNSCEWESCYHGQGRHRQVHQIFTSIRRRKVGATT